MSPEASLVLVLLGTTVLAAFAPILSRVLGRAAGYPLSVGFAAGALVLGLQAPRVIGGRAVEVSLPWIPSLGVRLEFVLDGLALLFSLLILGIGALVMAYSAGLLRTDRPHGRFYGLLTLFAVSMLGLVQAGDVIVLFVFWELTSITSFFLIGGDGGEQSGKAATRAFLVTGLGGLALFGGLVLLAVAAGATDLRTILADGGALRDHAVAPAAMALVLLGAFTKSAQFPFQFWLSGAMVAPTPVSTYLHAATMVKAGIYLVARLTPVFGGSAPWVHVIVLTGLVTSVLGAAVALRKHDMKIVLAYSTVSQLGFIIALVGVGTPAAMVAATVQIIAHALYKATLFMVVGIIDHEAGSRDLRRLSGLRKVMPVTAAITALAGLSLVGLPPFLGFVGKEEAFAAFLGTPGAGWLAPVAAILAVLAAVLTFAYGARIFYGAFGGPVQQRLFDPRTRLYLPAAVSAVAGLGLGVAVSWLDPFVGRVAADALRSPGAAELALWHGFTPALWLSLLTIAGGTTAFLLRRVVDRVMGRVRAPTTGAEVHDLLYDGVVGLGRVAGRPFLAVAPGRHLLWVLGFAVAAGLGAWVARGGRPEPSPPVSMPWDWVIAGLLVLAVVGAAGARTRIAAVAMLGTAGFLVAVFYLVLGAPDLALTQLLVETLTVAMVVLVFRRLPTTFRAVSRRRELAAGAVGVGIGSLAGLATLVLTGRRPPSEAAAYFLEAAPAEAGGRNVVNTILVDFRALDTLGEITVLAVAAIGVFALIRLGRRGRESPSPDEVAADEGIVS